MSPSFSAFAAVSFDIPIGGLLSPNIGENGILYFESANDAPEVVTPGLFCLCPATEGSCWKPKNKMSREVPLKMIEQTCFLI